MSPGSTPDESGECETCGAKRSTIDWAAVTQVTVDLIGIGVTLWVSLKG